jgi:hypothetical protein
MEVEPSDVQYREFWGPLLKRRICGQSFLPGIRDYSYLTSFLQGICSDSYLTSFLSDICGDSYSKSFVPDIRGESRPEVSAVVRKRWADDFDFADADEEHDFAKDFWQQDYALDDVNGRVLDIAKVREARSEEVEFMKSRCIWREVPLQACWDKTGKPPLTVKWVDTEKLGGVVRSRLVARDFKTRAESIGRTRSLLRLRSNY